MRKMREEDLVILVGAICCLMILGATLVAFHIRENRYNQACELQDSGYEVYIDGEKNDAISIQRLAPDYYKIRIDEDKKEIILNKKLNMW